MNQCKPLDLDLPAALVGGLQKDLCDFWDAIEANMTAAATPLRGVSAY